MTIVYRGVSQNKKPVSRSKSKLARTYRGVTYSTQAKEPHQPSEHIYRGCSYMA